ncbi:MAG: SRPBCC family protein [Candidatus Margulisiibacteriota bacterium]
MTPVLMPDISNSRLLNAPLDVVWELWSDPTHLAQWWGPRGFRNTISRHEFKPGGEWEFIMHGPDGTDYPNLWIYKDITPKTRLVMDHRSHPKFQVTIGFEPAKDDPNRTWIQFDMTFENPEVAEAIKDYAILGNEQNLERLEAALAEKTGTVLAKPFVLSRTFNASPEILWDMWTKPEHMRRWWGAQDFGVAYSKMDFRRGGSYHYGMTNPDGSTIWGKMWFKDIVLHKRLMFINGFSDEHGGIAQHPMNPGWPKELLSTIHFESENGKTNLTIEWVPINATPAEIECFNNGHDSMTGGWTGTLDRLEEALTTL